MERDFNELRAEQLTAKFLQDSEEIWQLMFATGEYKYQKQLDEMLESWLNSINVLGFVPPSVGNYRRKKK